jgi:hypothetical protein
MLPMVNIFGEKLTRLHSSEFPLALSLVQIWTVVPPHASSRGFVIVGITSPWVVNLPQADSLWL